MTSIKHRPFYSQEELDKLYPETLELELVQVLLRHGERAPVSARFRNAGLSPYWPYCHAAQQMRSVIYSPSDIKKWDSLQWRRRLERFGDDDGPVVASGPGSEVDGICQLGELTNKGRETTYELGERLRHLYVDQLRFMPTSISDADMIYLRATPMPRALESVQQAFWGMYPVTSRAASFPPPTIITRTPADETLYPNEGGCRRFGELAKAFSQKAADYWNDSEEMDYVTKKITKWMPEESKKVAVDSHPRLSGIMDTINSTLAHGPETRLPGEFYDDRLRQIIEKVGTEEWFAGYTQNREYRTLGTGALAGDIVERMVSKVDESGLSIGEVGGEIGKLGKGRGGETSIKLGLSGCHDTTLAGLLAGLGLFESHAWPPYTSHVAVEMFKKKASPVTSTPLQQPLTAAKSQPLDTSSAPKPGWIASVLGIFSNRSSAITSSSSSTSTQMGRKPYSALSSTQKSKLDNYYVRVRFNDAPLAIPACRQPGNHFEDDETLCTLEVFKRVVDGFTPKSWKGECNMNLGAEIVGVKKLKDVAQPAGHIEDGY